MSLSPAEAAARRRRAAELFAAGVSPAEVARQLGVSRQTAHRWHVTWRDGGAGALEPSGTRGPQARLTDTDLRTVAAVLLRGSAASGFSDAHWTCRQVGWVIEQTTGVSYHPAHVSRLIRRHGWSVNPPFTGLGDQEASRRCMSRVHAMAMQWRLVEQPHPPGHRPIERKSA